MDSQAVIINVETTIADGKRQVNVLNRIKRVNPLESFKSILRSVYDSFDVSEKVEVRVSSSNERKEEASIDFEETLALANEIFTVKTISFNITQSKDETSETRQEKRKQRTVNEALMGKDLPVLLKTLAENDKKDALHNELIRDLQKEPFLAGRASQEDGHKAIRVLSNALWYLDGRSKTINDASTKRSNVTPVPAR